LPKMGEDLWIRIEKNTFYRWRWVAFLNSALAA